MNAVTCLPAETASEEETLRLGARLAAELGADGVVLLEGDLGAGKTVLVRGMARALGVDPAAVQSPSFGLIHEHEGDRGRLVHVDLYRLDPSDLEALGLDELLEGPGLKAVEWAERLPWRVPGGRVVRIEIRDGGRRTVRETGAHG